MGPKPEVLPPMSDDPVPTSGQPHAYSDEGGNGSNNSPDQSSDPGGSKHAPPRKRFTSLSLRGDTKSTIKIIHECQMFRRELMEEVARLIELQKEKEGDDSVEDLQMGNTSNNKMGAGNAR